MTRENNVSRIVVYALASALLAFALAACSGGQGQATSNSASGNQGQASAQASSLSPIDTAGGSPWIDSNLKANIEPDMVTSPKDDFYLWANYDWLRETEIPEGERTAGVNMGAAGRANAMAAVSGADLAGHDACQAQLLYRAAADTAARDTAGAQPAQATVDAIRSLATIDDVSAFLLDAERSAGVPTLVRVLNVTDPDDATRYVARVDTSPATFGSSMGTVGMDATSVGPDDSLYQARLACASAVLVRCGLSAEEAKAAFENRIELEKRLIGESGQGGSDEVATTEVEGKGEAAEAAENPRLKIDQLDGLAGDFPLRNLAEARGYGEAKEFLVSDEAELRAVAALYTQDNIALVRDYLLVGYALEAASWLDGEAFDAWRADYAALGYYDELAQTGSTAEETAFDITCYTLKTPVGRAYAEAFDLTRAKEYVEGLCRDAIEAHKEIVNASGWLSDASKQRLCEKLDGLTVRAVYPDAWEDYSSLDLEGLSYYEARRAIWLDDAARNAALTNAEVDGRLWRNPTLVGVAAYDSGTNSFLIPAGSVQDGVERYEAGEISLGELLGGPVGYCVFHEVGHAIDSTGMSIDKDGNRIDGSLLEPVDQEEFERRVQKAKAYYDSIVAFTGQNVVGEVCVNEGLAEICGHRARLAYAAKQDGFDYKAFYEARAKMARCLRTPEFERQCIQGADTHPSAYLDVNGPAQMFDEFYETYDVKEGDGMYLAPEDRLVLW